MKNKQLYYIKLMEVLAWLSIAAGFFLAIHPLRTGLTIFQRLMIFAVFISISACIAYVLVQPKKRISIRVAEKTIVKVFFGDIFEAKTNIVIPANEYFTSYAHDEVFSSTLRAEFINLVFGANAFKLVNAIEEKPRATGPMLYSGRPRGNTKRYKLGTTILHIEEHGKRFFLLGLNNFNTHNNAMSSNMEYQSTLHSLLDYLHTYSQGEEINLSLIGAGQSGITLTKQELLEFLICAINLHDDLSKCGGINIVLRRSFKEEIDLNRIEYMNKLARA